MTTTQTWTEEFIDVAGTKTQVIKGGSGPPLLILHGARGNHRWMPYHEALSKHHTVYASSHPGYDKTPRPPWVSTINDVAHFYLAFMRNAGLSNAALVGFSMGGWIAAEIAAMDSHRVKGMVLVDAVGVRPQVGEIAEILMVSPEQTQDLVYHDPSKAPEAPYLSPDEDVQWTNREMASRLCWKPYMHNPVLPDYLKLIDVPSLIVWGRQDGIVPVNAGEIYHQSLKGSTLHVIEECGHSPQFEKPQEFLDVTQAFLSKL